MTTGDDGITDERAERIGQNIDLAFRFLDEVLDDPSRLDALPDEATVVFVPGDDPGLAAANLATAERLVADQTRAEVWLVDIPDAGREPWPASRGRSNPASTRLEPDSVDTGIERRQAPRPGGSRR